MKRLNTAFGAAVLVYLVVEGFIPSDQKFTTPLGWLPLPVAVLVFVVVAYKSIKNGATK